MAKSETSWKPGESGNPEGRVKLPEDIRTAKKLNKIELERLLNLYLTLSDDEIKARLSTSETPQLEKMIASIVTKAIDHGDQQRLTFILDRLVGKVKDEIDVTVIPRPVIIERHDGTSIELTSEVKEIEE
jgi:hypothetical protein